MFARLEHGGAEKKAIAALRGKGYGPSRDKSDINRFEGELKNYLRVGTKYYKLKEKADIYGVARGCVEEWSRQTIIDDFGKDNLKNIRAYDGFVNDPDNTASYKSEIDGYKNSYQKCPFVPRQGDFTTTRKFLDHVFGEQFNTGMKIMQLYYLYPKKIAPILVLISEERETGKTTFLNYLKMIIGRNMIICGLQDLTSEFNRIIGQSVIIGVEEAQIASKSDIMEKLKAHSTQKYIISNEKYVGKYEVPFYGKFILTSNNEQGFAKIDEPEIRFFIRKLTRPIEVDHDLELKLLKEIPAFLYFLQHDLPEIDFNGSRTGFLRNELDNQWLREVKNESKSDTYHKLKEIVVSVFEDKEDLYEFYLSAKDVKEFCFADEKNLQIKEIRKCLKNEFKLGNENNMRYTPLFGLQAKTGTPFRFRRENFM